MADKERENANAAPLLIEDDPTGLYLLRREADAGVYGYCIHCGMLRSATWWAGGQVSEERLSVRIVSAADLAGYPPILREEVARQYVRLPDRCRCPFPTPPDGTAAGEVSRAEWGAWSQAGLATTSAAAVDPRAPHREEVRTRILWGLARVARQLTLAEVHRYDGRDGCYTCIFCGFRITTHEVVEALRAEGKLALMHAHDCAVTHARRYLLAAGAHGLLPVEEGQEAHEQDRRDDHGHPSMGEGEGT